MLSSLCRDSILLLSLATVLAVSSCLT